MDDSIRRAVADRLDAIEDEHDVTVLYACESGSRAWGFASADSDYDVRFLYAHPRDWYLSIDLERRDDTIDPPIDDEIDLHGWDLRKALGLFRKSNPPLLEWLQSPVVYREDEAVMDRWRALMPDYYTPRAAGYHYLHMAQGNYESYLQDRDRVWVKKYFYVLRPLLGIRWIEQDRGPVPMEFARLVQACIDDPDLRTAIDDLVARKQAGAELDEGPRLPTIHGFIEDEFDRLADTHFADDHRPKPLAPLNALFRNALSHLNRSPE
jgi:predicted nucleotidyltransferase